MIPGRHGLPTFTAPLNLSKVGSYRYTVIHLGKVAQNRNNGYLSARHVQRSWGALLYYFKDHTLFDFG